MRKEENLRRWKVKMTATQGGMLINKAASENINVNNTMNGKLDITIHDKNGNELYANKRACTPFCVNAFS